MNTSLRLLLVGVLIVTLHISCTKQQESIPSQPIIDSIAPLFAKEGDVITVYGKYFNGTASVLINDKAAKAQVVSNALRVTVPEGTFPTYNDLLAKVQIKISGFKDTASAYFYSTLTPRMYTMLPTTVHIGDTITITGAGFVKGRDERRIRFLPPLEYMVDHQVTDDESIEGQYVNIMDDIVKIVVPANAKTGVLAIFSSVPGFIPGSMQMMQPITIIQ